MATFNNLSKEYADYIRLNQANPTVVTEIVNRINGLTYTESGKPLTESDRTQLIDAIEQEFSKEKTTGDGTRLVEAEDSRQLIKLVAMVRTQAKKGK